MDIKKLNEELEMCLSINESQEETNVFHFTLNPQEKKTFANLEGLTGEECYQNYGLNREETISTSYDFGLNGKNYRAIFDLVVPLEFEEYVWVQCGIYEIVGEGLKEITYSDCEEEIAGEWNFELDDDTEITIIVE